MTTEPAYHIPARTGTVKWFSPKKGYGFLVDDSTGEEVFIHHTAICGEGYRSLSPGWKVGYALSTGEKGSRAMEVVRL